MDEELKSKIVNDLLDNIPQRFRHNRTIQQKKDFISFRVNKTKQLQNVGVFVSESERKGFYEVGIIYHQSEPYAITVNLNYRMKGISDLVLDNLSSLKR